MKSYFVAIQNYASQHKAFTYIVEHHTRQQIIHKKASSKWRENKVQMAAIINIHHPTHRLHKTVVYTSTPLHKRNVTLL